MKFSFRKAILWITVLVMAWTGSVAAMIWITGAVDHAAPSDCAIIMGAAAYGNKPSPVFAARIEHGIDLYKSGTVKKLIFTGGFGKGAAHAESEVGRTMAIKAGIPTENILIETRSHTTHENLIEAKALMDQATLTSAILVSDPLHLKRSSMMATDLGIHAVTSPAPNTRYRSFRPKLDLFLHEFYFFHHYLITGK